MRRGLALCPVALGATPAGPCGVLRYAEPTLGPTPTPMPPGADQPGA